MINVFGDYSELCVVYVNETRMCAVVNLQVYENCLLKFDITKRLKFKLLVQERGLSKCVPYLCIRRDEGEDRKSCIT